MEALGAIGLASNVIQLVEFTASVISQASELSKIGMLHGHAVLQTVTQDLQG